MRTLSLSSILSRFMMPALWLCAFVCALYFNNEWQMTLFILAIALGFIWAMAGLWAQAKDGFNIPQSYTLLFVLMFWGLVGLSISWSEIPYISLMGFCFFSVLPLTFLTLVLRRDHTAMVWMGYGLAGIMVLLSVWAMVQFFFLNDLFEGRAHHPLADPNALGALFNLALFPAIGWMLGTKDKTQGRIALALSALLIGGLMCTGSRGAFLSCLVTLIVFLWLNRSVLQAHKKCLLLLGVIGLGFFALSATGDRPHENMIQRVGETLTTSVPAMMADVSSNRLDIWAGAMNLLKDHLWMGTGFATFYLYYPEYRLPQDEVGATMAHADPLQYWIELGVLGPALFYAVLIAVFCRFRRFLKHRTPSDNASSLVAVSSFCALMAVIGHTHISFNLYNLSLLFGVGFMLAVWFLATALPRDAMPRHFGFPATLSASVRGALTVLPLAMILYVFTAYTISESLVNKARDQIFAGDLFNFGETLNIAHKIGFHGNYRAYLLAANVPMGILQGSAKELDIAKQEELYVQTLSFLNRAKAMNPRSASATYYLGRVQQLVPPEIIPAGTASPKSYFEAALRLDPLHLGARGGLAQIYQTQGDQQQLYTVLKAGLPYQYRDPKAMGFYAQVMMACLEAGDQACRAETVARMTEFKARAEKSARRQKWEGSSPVIGAEGALADTINR